MSVTFTKLFSSITESTIWCEDSDIRIVWITMLAMCDRHGRVWASIPGLANRAQVSLEMAEKALNKFLSPDPYSRTSEYEGRRIEAIDGGWRLLNHEKYRAIRDEEERKEYKRKWIAEKRAKDKDVDNVDQSRPQYTHTDTDTDTDTEKNKTLGDISDEISPPPREKIPIQKIIELYHEILPELPRVAKLTAKRKGQIQQRWREDIPSLNQWKNFFTFVRKNDFLMGRCQPRDNRPPFLADLEWLTNATNFTKIAEKKYVQR